MLKTISEEKREDHIALDFGIKDFNNFFNLEKCPHRKYHYYSWEFSEDTNLCKVNMQVPIPAFVNIIFSFFISS